MANPKSLGLGLSVFISTDSLIRFIYKKNEILYLKTEYFAFDRNRNDQLIKSNWQHHLIDLPLKRYAFQQTDIFVGNLPHQVENAFEFQIPSTLQKITQFYQSERTNFIHFNQSLATLLSNQPSAILFYKRNHNLFLVIRSNGQIIASNNYLIEMPTDLIYYFEFVLQSFFREGMEVFVGGDLELDQPILEMLKSENQHLKLISDIIGKQSNEQIHLLPELKYLKQL